MGDYYDPLASRKPSAFTRLSSHKAKGGGADPPAKAAANIPLDRIFNQVQVSSTHSKRRGDGEPHLGKLQKSVDDLKASTATLFALQDVSREVRETNLGASAASVKMVEAAARLAEDVGRRILGDNQAATDAQAEKLTVATVERLLRS